MVAHKTLVSAPIPIGIGIRGLGQGLDNILSFRVYTSSGGPLSDSDFILVEGGNKVLTENHLDISYTRSQSLTESALNNTSGLIAFCEMLMLLHHIFLLILMPYFIHEGNGRI